MAVRVRGVCCAVPLLTVDCSTTACTPASSSSCCSASLSSRHSCAFIELTGSRHSDSTRHDAMLEEGVSCTYDQSGDGGAEATAEAGDVRAVLAMAGALGERKGGGAPRRRIYKGGPSQAQKAQHEGSARRVRVGRELAEVGELLE